MNNFYNDELPEFFSKPQNYHFKSKLYYYPINHAAFFGEIDSVKYFIDLGVDLDAPGDLGRTALHEAVSNEHFDIVKLLVESGADFNIKDDFGKTALEWAALQQNKKIWKWLALQTNENIKLDFPVLLNLYGEKYFGGDTINSETKTDIGENLIHIAVKRGRQSEVKCFIEYGIDVNAVTDNGLDFTPLHYSIGMSNFDMMRFLLRSGANFNLKSGMGYSPLDLAILIGDKKTIFYLYSYISRTIAPPIS